MPDDPDKPVVLTTAPTEGEAAIIVAALEDEGFRAQMSGQLTSGFRAEAPGEVSVLVRQADYERAKQTLEKIRSEEA